MKMNAPMNEVTAHVISGTHYTCDIEIRHCVTRVMLKEELVIKIEI